MYPNEFLIEIATKYELSPDQQEAFIKRINNTHMTDEGVAQSLHTSPSAFRTRMTEVYRKFQIGGDGPGKLIRLRQKVFEEFNQSRHSNPGINVLEDTYLKSRNIVREARKTVEKLIRSRCSEMRVLYMSEPVKLEEIYTNVKILGRITGQRRLEISEILNNSVIEDQIRPKLGSNSPETLSGLAAVDQKSKLIILGKPGAGKTTFLKQIAIQCISGNFRDFQVPVFIGLKDFAETSPNLSLLDYIKQEFFEQFPLQKLEFILNQGKGLILLDGLDEVRDKDVPRVTSEIQKFTYKKFPENNFVISCRIAAREYVFENFIEVEVADFDDLQILDFVKKWFRPKNYSKADLFMRKLQENLPIRELATNPLLLTLLCLVFEESISFPENRAELYQEGIATLLKKWDGTRNIERDQIYKELSPLRKEGLLSYIALETFEQGKYFFKENKIREYITDYVHRLNKFSDSDNSEAILKSIEAQHGLLVERARGIYSFSHLTFHEYFTARSIVNNSDPSNLDKSLRKLMDHITEKHWREVFLLIVNMLPNADYFLKLMREKTNSMVVDESVQSILLWTYQKSTSTSLPYSPAAVRAFLLARDLDLDCDRSLSKAISGDSAITRDTQFMSIPRGSSEIYISFNKFQTNLKEVYKLANYCNRARTFYTNFDEPKYIENMQRGYELIEKLSSEGSGYIEESTLEKVKALRDLFPRLDVKDISKDKYTEESWEKAWKWWQYDSLNWLESLKAIGGKNSSLEFKLWNIEKEVRQRLHDYLREIYNSAKECSYQIQSLYENSNFQLASYEASHHRCVDILENMLGQNESFILHEVKITVQNLRNKLPILEENTWSTVWDFWVFNGQDWIEELSRLVNRNCQIEYENILSAEAKTKLYQYYEANKLLVDCLNTDCCLTPGVRQEIEDTLLLPIAEIQKRRSFI